VINKGKKVEFYEESNVIDRFIFYFVETMLQPPPPYQERNDVLHSVRRLQCYKRQRSSNRCCFIAFVIFCLIGSGAFPAAFVPSYLYWQENFTDSFPILSDFVVQSVCNENARQIQVCYQGFANISSFQPNQENMQVCNLLLKTSTDMSAISLYFQNNAQPGTFLTVYWHGNDFSNCSQNPPSFDFFALVIIAVVTALYSIASIQLLCMSFFKCRYQIVNYYPPSNIQVNANIDAYDNNKISEEPSKSSSTKLVFHDEAILVNE
jgi:hypothetical protein